MITNPSLGMKVLYIGNNLKHKGKSTCVIIDMNYDRSKALIKWREFGERYVVPIEDLVPAVEDNIESIW